ncbi:MAG: hypothetical protein HY320_06715, partial [Armatimonadetes bacterium]|nr:hypothetical protein [Armatimonadota bacterium]
MTVTLTRREFLKFSLVVTGHMAVAGWGAPHWLKGSFVPLPANSRGDLAGSCLALVQSPWLGMAALGDNTMPDPNKGNHLRWGFEPLLGFPAGGFDLYRRPHYEGQPVCVILQGYASNQVLGQRITLGELLLASTADIRLVELVPDNGAPEIDLRGGPPLAIWPREVCHRMRIGVVDFHPAGGTIQATAYDGDVLVAFARSVASNKIQYLEVAADRIDRVIIHPPGEGMKGVLAQICYTTVAGDVCQGQFAWTRLNKEPVCLPLSDASYPCPSKPATPADEWPAARRRIPPDTWGQFGPPNFTDLRQSLALIYNPDDTPLPADPAEICPPPSSDDEVPALAQDPLGMVLLAALEPPIARMLGLYWIDGTHYVDQGLQAVAPAAVGSACDYLLVAHYPATAASADACDGWDGDAAGSSISGRAFHGPLTYDTVVPLSVVNRRIDAFSTNRALSIPDNQGKPLRLTLPEAAQAVELYVDLPDAAARAIARAYSHGVEVDTAIRPASINGPTVLLLVAESIDAVELEGRNLYLAKSCYYTSYLPGGDMGFIVYNVALGEPPVLPPPGYLHSDPLPVLTRQDPECDPVTGQMAAGLRWERDLAGGGILPGGAVLYNLERQGLGNGNAPGAVKPGAWLPVQSNILVIPDPPEARCEPFEALPGWPDSRPDAIDAPPEEPQQRWYAYRVRGIDIFGRRSANREAAPIDLTDRVPPPPPADVRARYLDPADPYLAPDEHAWIHPASGAPPRHGLRVGWRWTANLQEQAPDVAQFRVYFKAGRLNVVLGNITSVGAPDASGHVQVATDVAAASLLAGDVPDAFQGEFLSQEVHLYQVVASGSAGGNLTLTLKRERWMPPDVPGLEIEAPELQPIPVPGPFSLSVRPPRDLSGRLTAVSLAEFSEEMWVETDMRYTGAANALAGLKLRQGGRLWQIFGNTTGWKFAIYLRPRDCEPVVPTQGEGFLVVEADGVTPHRLDGGNPHARDYRDPLQWEERLHLEPRTHEPTGLITAVADNGDGTSTLTTNATLDDPSGHYLGGELQVGAYTWPVVGHTAGSNFRLTVLHNRRDRLAGTVDRAGPAVGATFTYWPDIVIPLGSPLAIPPGQPAAYAAVGVSAADNKSYVADVWPKTNGGQHGNESAVSPPAIIARVDRSAPPPPEPNTDVLMATPADFYSRSFFTVRWAKGPDSSLRYRVYRALANPDGSEPPLDRYHLITPEPLQPADHPDTAEPGHPADPLLMAYRDTLDGRSRSRYYYRVRAVNGAGTPGAWSLPTGPVACPDVTPPRAPVITRVLGGDRQITLRWASNREPDLAGYRLYRADSQEAARDLRLMALRYTEPVPAGDPAARPAEITFVDDTALPYTDTFYRMVAVDAAGNISSLSRAVAGRAFDQSPPGPPTWQRAVWVKVDAAGGVHPWSAAVEPYRPATLLAWYVGQAPIKSLVQRRAADGGGWG